MEVRRIVAAKGVSITAGTVTYTPLPRIAGTGKLSLEVRSLTTAVVAMYLLNPKPVILRTNDGGLTFTDVTEALADSDTATSMANGALKTLEKGGAIYVGVPVDIAGLVVDVGTANAVASTLAVDFWNGSAWVTASADASGVASGGAPFAVDGKITWTAPTTSQVAKLREIVSNGAAPPAKFLEDKDYALSGVGQWLGRELKWYRISHTNATSAPLTTPSTILQILTINKSTSYAELPSGIAYRDHMLNTEAGDINGIGCVQADVDAGSGLVMMNLEGQFI